MLHPVFDLPTLLDKALRDGKQAVVVIADPLAGEDAAIHSANDSFRSLIGRDGKLSGMPLGDLRPLAEMPGEWSAFITALRRQAPIQLELRLRVAQRQRCFQFRLTFDEDEVDARYAILVGRDVTRCRRQQTQEEKLQRLLAAVFQHAGVPLMIVDPGGTVLMANLAARDLLDYPGDGLIGVNVSRLAAPEFHAEAAVARAKQLQDGGRYELRFDALTRTGSRLPVRLVSVLLHDLGGQRLRIVTWLPESATAAEVESYNTPSGAVGQVMAVSLEALKQACGETWPRIQARAMIIAEGIIKRRLAAGDVLSRGEGNCFIIWFQTKEPARNEATLTGIVREVRLRVLMEHGGDLAIQPVAIPLAPGEPALAAAPAAAGEAPRTGTAGSESPAATAAGSGPPADLVAKLVQEARAAKPECRNVTGRDGAGKPSWSVDFAAPLRRRIVAAAALLAGEHPNAGEFDLLRFGMALAELAARPAPDCVLVQLSWPSLATVEVRRRLDDRLTRLDTETRARLIVLVSELPAQLTAPRWTGIVGPLRRLVADVAPVLTVTQGQTPNAPTWPLTLLAIDATVPNALPPDEFFTLIEAIRRRDMAVLVLSSKADQLDWRELGATLFLTE